MRVAYRGERKTIVWAESRSGILGLEYFDNLSGADQRKIDALFQRMGDAGQIRNTEQFRKEEGEVWAFKSFQHRLYCFFDGRDIVITHGVRKKAKSPGRILNGQTE